MRRLFRQALVLGIIGLFKFLSPAEDLHAQTIGAVVGGISSTPTNPRPSSVFWNPSIIGFSPDTDIDGNLSILGGWLIYDRKNEGQNDSGGYFKSSSTSQFAPSPFFSIVSPLGSSQFRFAYSTYFPSGVMAKFDPSGSQRYDLIQGMMVPWHHMLTIAYRPSPEWSFALSGIYSLGFFQAERDIDLGVFMKKVFESEDVPSEHSSLAARAKIPLSTSSAFGGAAGITYWPAYQWTFGVAFFSPMTYEFNGQLDLDMPSSVSVLGSGLKALGAEEHTSNSITATTTLPAFIQAGFRYQPFGYWNIEHFGRYTFSSWNRSLDIQVHESSIAKLRNFPIAGKHLQDTWLLGAVHSFHFWKTWTLGFNFTYTTSAVRENTLSVTQADFDSFFAGIFAQYSWNDHWNLGLEYGHHFLFERTARNTKSGSAPTGANDIFEPTPTDGDYRAGADRFGLVLRYAF